MIYELFFLDYDSSTIMEVNKKQNLIKTKKIYVNQASFSISRKDIFVHPYEFTLFTWTCSCIC